MMCAFTVLLLRLLGIHPAAAAFSALTLLFAPQVLLDIAHSQINPVLSLTLLPVILYFAHLFMRQRLLLWFVVSVFMFTFQLLRGSAAVSIVTIVLLLIFTLINSIQRTKSNKILDLFLNSGFILVLLALGFVGAAYVLLPLSEFLRFADIVMSPLKIEPNDFLLFTYPTFNGEWAVGDNARVLYFGLLSLFLAGFLFLARRDPSTVLFGLVIIGLLIVGFVLPANLTTHGLPVVFGLLAGLGIHLLIQYQQRNKQRPSRWLDVYMLMFLGAVVAGCIFLFFNEPIFSRHILARIPLLTITRRHHFFHIVLLESAIAFVLIALAFLLVRLFLRSRMTPLTFIGGLLLLAISDFYRLNDHIQNTIQPTAVEMTPRMRQEMQNDPSFFRVFSSVDEPLKQFQSITGTTVSRLLIYHEFLEETGLNLPDSPWMHNPFFSKYARLISRAGEIVEQPIPVQNINPARVRFDRSVLDLLNVRYILCHSPIHDPLYPLLQSEGGLYLYKNLTALPRAFMVDSVYISPAGRATFDAMNEPAFDPRQVVFIEGMPPLDVSRADSNVVNIASYAPGLIQLQVQAQENAVLVLSEVYYPVGWTALIDQRPVTIYKANSLLRAVFVPQGRHSVEFRFLPKSFRNGVRISQLFSLLMVSGLGYGLYTFIKLKKRAEAKR